VIVTARLRITMLSTVSPAADHSFTRDRGDDGGRFCHQRCREWFDAGNPAHCAGQRNVRSDPRLEDHCPAPGVKLGASYYGAILDRKRPLRRGQTEPTELIRPRRPCQRCGSPLPVWINGKALRNSVKYCEGCRT
jgi:hypothetical protein